MAEAELYVDLMSHDINNMNQVAAGSTELAIEKLSSAGELGADDLPLLTKTREMLDNSSMLIENVGKLRKARTADLAIEDIDLARVIEELRSTYFKLSSKNVAINYTLENGCIVRANELVKDIFYNLIGNAIKHSGSKQLSIDVTVERIGLDGKEYCRVSVADNGHGISDDIKKRIFRRFERGNAKTRGKGLGLYLVKELAERFNGRVWVEDRVPGDYRRGCKFVVLLPAGS
jgi:signal transduction histidine kinase